MKKKPRRKQSRHHRKPASLGGQGNAENISVVNPMKHRAWHLLFENKSAEEIAKIINEVWIDPDYELVCCRREKWTGGF